MTGHFNRKYVIFLAITAALGGLLFGFDVAIITGAGPFLVRQFDLSDLSLGCARAGGTHFRRGDCARRGLGHC
jgi:hypothetical protein